MSEYTSKLKSLFKEWNSDDDPSFIEDGLLDIEDETKYDNSKILFLNKEAYWDPNDPNGQYRNVAGPIRVWNRPRYLLWHRVADICTAIQRIKVDYALPPLSNIRSDENWKAFFMSCAVMNVKKSRGKSRSSYKDLKKYYEFYKNFIWRQIEILGPRIVVCGGTFIILKDSDVFSSVSNIKRLYSRDGIFFIDHFHPSYFRISNESFYKSFAETFQQYLKYKANLP